MSQGQGIDYFGSGFPFASLHSKTTVRIRRKIYDFLKEIVGEVKDKTFLEHGATPETNRAASNCFIRWLLEDGANVYATSPERISHLEQVFPQLVVLDWPLTIASVEQVDYIISSAVLEHVGSENEQVEYVSHLLKLESTILLTTPNRYHWLEFHTKIPLLHWLPRHWHQAFLTRFGLRFWASEDNLRLLSRTDLIQVIDQAARINEATVQLHWYQPYFLGMVSNLCVLITKA